MITNLTQDQVRSARRLLELSLGNYLTIRRDYEYAIKAALGEYLFLNGKLERTRKDMTRAMATAFVDAFEQGFIDGGGKPPMDANAGEYLGARQEAEQGYIKLLFQSMKALKEDGDPAAMEQAIFDRSTGYLATLDGIYNEGRLRGMGRGNKMLTFAGEDGEENCTTCRKLKGARHRARWWIEHGLVPGEPGNPNFDCHGYKCKHFLHDDAGMVATI